MITDFLLEATTHAVKELLAALDRIPVEKRGWQYTETARSALDQVAECALLNGNTAELVESRAGKPIEYGEEYERAKAALINDESAIRALLTTNTERALKAIRQTPDTALNEIIPLPWGSMPLHELLLFPCWNMIYHTGQIGYIASLLSR